MSHSSFSSTNDLTIPTIKQQKPLNLYHKMKEALTIGQDSTIKLRSRLLGGSSDLGGGDDDKSNDDIVNVILASFTDGLSLLNGNESRAQVLLLAKKGIETNKNAASDICDNGGSNSSENSVWPVKNLEDRRVLYKRKKPCELSERITETAIDDGHAWRKYGQKPIHGSIHPRSYYRCTYKVDQQCPALKQVQKISDNPRRYKTVYLGHHTCQNPLKATQQLVLRDIHDVDDQKNMLSFKTNYYPDAVLSTSEQPLMPTSPRMTMLSTAHDYNRNQQYHYPSPSIEYHVASSAGSTELGEVISGSDYPCSPSVISIDYDINNYLMIGHDEEINAMLGIMGCF